MKSSLPVLGSLFCLGIFFSKFLFFNFWVIFSASAVIIIYSCLKQDRISLALLFIALGILCSKNHSYLPKSHISRIFTPGSSFVSGFVASVPEEKANRLEFIFRVKKIESAGLRRNCCGEILVKAGSVLRKISYGDNLILIGSPEYINSDYLKRKSILLTMKIGDFRQIIFEQGNSGSILIKNSHKIRRKLEALVNYYFPDFSAGILSAMLLGLKSQVPWLVNNSMVKTGTIHILVVSGFNVAIVAFVFNLLFKISRIPRKARILLVIICLIFYCFITGSSNPVVRATLMAVIWLCAYLFKRDARIYISLSLSGFLILFFSPKQLFDIGFQLSFISVFSIVYFYPKLKKFFDPDRHQFKPLKFICEGFLVSLSAWLGTAPVIAINFGIISTVTVLANILIVPLASLVTLAGFTFLLVALILPAQAHYFSLPVSFLINLILGVNYLLARLPFAYFTFDKTRPLW